jgi:uncharacterized protein (TIGR02757 family)
MSEETLKELLDRLAKKYNTPAFIPADPISIPHRFSKKEDIEISGFLASVIAWGNRCSILKSASKIMEMMDNDPHNFVCNAKGKELKPLSGFVHRTFNGSDMLFFAESLKNIYQNYNGLHGVFSEGFSRNGNIPGALSHFRKIFLEADHEKRSEKHIPDIAKKTAAKKINMYLRWMVRRDRNGVDFGLWRNIPTDSLLMPLDVHSAATARKLGLLTRKQNDLRSVIELTDNLKKFRPEDPVYYDYALFGAGVGKEIISSCVN